MTNLKLQRYDHTFVMKSVVAGGVAGMCAKSFVAPLDRIKILLQAQNIKYKNEGVVSGLRKIVVEENFRALYKGNGAQMVRIFPYASTQFTAYEMYKQVLMRLMGNHTGTGRFFVSGISGSLAGVTAVFLTYPLDTVRARLAFQVAGSHLYGGIIDAATTIFRSEGFGALYLGFWATVCGMIPYAGISFYTFERLKYIFMKYFPSVTCKPCDRNTGGLVLMIPVKLLCGGLAGAVAQSVSYPLDVTRRRMQLSGMCSSTAKYGEGMFRTLCMVYNENGIVRGLYRGMSINYLRAVPMVAVSFSTYELVKQALGLDTGFTVKVG